MIDDEVQTYDAGEAIVTKGEPGSCMYVVLSGRAVLELADGGQHVFGAGDFFGEMAVIDIETRSATVRAEEDGTRVLPIDQARFIYLVSHQPVFAMAIMAGDVATAAARDGDADGGCRSRRWSASRRPRSSRALAVPFAWPGQQHHAGRWPA